MAIQHAEQLAKRTASVRGSDFDFSGVWTNELGSIMELSINGVVVTGCYQSAVSDNSGPTPWKDLTGTTSADLITFAVNWGPEITSWIGHGVVGNGRPQILTLWQLVKTIPDIENPETQWQTVMSGADNFSRG